MADPIIYEIKYTNGLFLTSLLETAVNKTSTSLTLYGRGTEEYGEGIQQNFVSMLENFAFSQPPLYPLPGQLWYDTNHGVLNVFSGTGWVAMLGAADTDLSLLEAGQISIIDSTKNIQYKTVGGDMSLSESGQATITKNSTVTLSGDIFGDGLQIGKGDVVISTAISTDAVGIGHLSPVANEDSFSGKLRNVYNGRQFIMMKVPHNIALKSLIIHTPNGVGNVDLEYNAVASNGVDMTTLAYTLVDSVVLASNIFNENALTTWIAPMQGLSFNFSGITGNIDEINYTIVYERV